MYIYINADTAWEAHSSDDSRRQQARGLPWQQTGFTREDDEEAEMLKDSIGPSHSRVRVAGGISTRTLLLWSTLVALMLPGASGGTQTVYALAAEAAGSLSYAVFYTFSGLCFSFLTVETKKVAWRETWRALKTTNSPKSLPGGRGKRKAAQWAAVAVVVEVAAPKVSWEA